MEYYQVRVLCSEVLLNGGCLEVVDFFNVESTEDADPGFFKDRDGDANPAGYIYVNTPPPQKNT